MPDLPNSLALTSIADDANIVASDHRNNYSAIQTGANGLITALSGGTAGQFLRATDTDTVTYAYPPGYELAYTQITSPVSVSSTTEASPTDVVSAGSVTFDGTAVWIEFYTPYFRVNTAASSTLNLYEDGTSIARLALTVLGYSGGQTYRFKKTPSAGAHTYKVGGWNNALLADVGAGSGGASAYAPAFIRITKA